MAFVYRAERDSSPHKNNTNLGPGSYIGLGKWHKPVVSNLIFHF